jgi:hypothetical protein
VAETQYAFVEARDPHRLLAFKVGALAQLDAPEAGVVVGRTGVGDARRDLEALLRMAESRQSSRRTRLATVAGEGSGIIGY